MLKHFKLIHQHEGFTLIELLMVIGILAVLGTVTFLTINPVDKIEQTRDIQRLVDLDNINKAFQLATVRSSSISDFFWGASSTVYVSLPSNNSDCSGLGLPALSGGWVYHCASQANYQKVDGMGWIPVNFSSLPAGSPLAVLPVDPINASTLGFYYSYVVGSWEITAILESAKYQQQYAKNDGGQSVTAVEKGSHLGITPLEILNRDSWRYPY